MSTSVESNPIQKLKLSGSWEMFTFPRLPKAPRPKLTPYSAPHHKGVSDSDKGTSVTIQNYSDLTTTDNAITFTLKRGGVVRVGNSCEYGAGGDTYVTIRATDVKPA